MSGINYTLGMNTAGFTSGAANALGKIAEIGKKAALITATAGAAAGVSLAALIGKSIGKAAEMEDLEAGFAPLLGGFQEAKDRMAELAQFAAATPFELPAIASASMKLQTLTQGALATGDALTMVGDVAAGPFAGDFERAAEYLGQLFDALHNGGEIGDVVGEMQKMGAISGDTKRQLQALHEQGGKGAEAWKAVTNELSQFNGAMAIKANTWNGKISTLTDTVSALMAQFGKPIMDSLVPYLDGLTVKIESMQAAGVQVGETIGKALELAFAAFQSGNGMEAAGAGLKLGFLEAVNALARGLQAAIAAAKAGMAPIFDRLSNAFMAIGEAFGATISAAILRALNQVPGMRGDLDGAIQTEQDTVNRAQRTTKRDLGGMFTEGPDFAAMQKKFSEKWESLPDFFNTGEASKKYEDIMEPIRKIAEDFRAQREKIKAEMDGKLKVSKGAAGAAASSSPAAKADASSVDRLSQIGGYVGGAASGLTQRAAEKTASYMERAVVRLTSIDRRLAEAAAANAPSRF